MKPHKMQNAANVFFIHEFREKYGFSQAEMAAMLGTTRGQLSHTEISRRPIPVEAERKFIALTEGIRTSGILSRNFPKCKKPFSKLKGFLK